MVNFRVDSCLSVRVFSVNCMVSCCFRTKARSAASVILRGANDFMVDEMERSLHDALCVVRRVLESKSVVPGGGAVEAALSIYLENFATSLVSTVNSVMNLQIYDLETAGPISASSIS